MYTVVHVCTICITVHLSIQAFLLSPSTFMCTYRYTVLYICHTDTIIHQHILPACMIQSSCHKAFCTPPNILMHAGWVCQYFHFIFSYRDLGMFRRISRLSSNEMLSVVMAKAFKVTVQCVTVYLKSWILGLGKYLICFGTALNHYNTLIIVIYSQSCAMGCQIGIGGIF